MGKMLEALKRIESREAASAEPMLTLRPFAIEPEDDPVEEETIPFIEVGGPREIVTSIPNAVEPVREEEKPAPPPRPVAAPLSVVFQPLSLAPAVLPPARERFAPELIAFHQPQHVASCQYRAVWTAIAAQLSTTTPQVLLFTAPAPDIGTTTVLLNLAISAARPNQQRVAVVDANWHRPAVAARLGLPASPGLGEVLAHRVALAQALQPSGLPNLEVITAGTCEESASVPRVGEAMWTLLRELRDQFDLILVDAPCWDGRPEIVALGSACDAVYLILRQSEADDPAHVALAERIVRRGNPLRGCILAQR